MYFCLLYSTLCTVYNAETLVIVCFVRIRKWILLGSEPSDVATAAWCASAFIYRTDPNHHVPVSPDTGGGNAQARCSC